ncbi:hypothetical protein TMatcc_005304 [Talaromyces marneffei ATCC 18224]
MKGNIQSYNYKPEDIFWGQLAGCLQSINTGVTTVIDHAHMTYSPDHGNPPPSYTYNQLKPFVQRPLPAYAPSSATAPSRASKAGLQRSITTTPYSRTDATLASLAKSAPYGGGRVTLGVGFDQFQLPKEVINLWEKSRELGVKLMTSHYVAHPMKNMASYPSPILFLFASRKDSVNLLSEYGLLDKSILFSHANGISESDAALLVSKGAHISTTPATEMQMGLGESVAFRNDTKHHASIGVDCHANNSSDLLTQLRLGMQQARAAEDSQAMARGEYPSVAIKVEVFNLGTIQGAKAINMEDQIGSIEVGKRVDLVVFDASSPGMVCAAEEDPVAAVLMYAGVGYVEIVIVDGVVRKQGGRLVGVRVLDGVSSTEMRVETKRGEARSRLLESRERIRVRGQGQDRQAAMHFLYKTFG